MLSILSHLAINGCHQKIVLVSKLWIGSRWQKNYRSPVCFKILTVVAAPFAIIELRAALISEPAQGELPATACYNRRSQPIDATLYL